MKHTTNQRPLYAYGSPQRVAEIMENSLQSDNIKAVKLYEEAVRVCHYKKPDALRQNAPDLFSAELEKYDPFQACLDNFKTLAVNGKDKKDGFDPTIQFDYFGQSTSVVHQIYTHKKSAKKFPELKKFSKVLKNEFTQDVRMADDVDKFSARQERLKQQDSNRKQITGSKNPNRYDNYKWEYPPGRSGFEAR